MIEPSSRRRFLIQSAVCGASLAGFSVVLRGDDVSATGTTGSALKPLDEMMTGFVATHSVPGASLAVAKNGRLLYARGFGLADRESKRPVEPTSLFRIASVSKPLTAVAIMKLVEDGKLTLDAPILDTISLKPLLADGAAMDERWKRITIRQLLQHTGGWDRDKSYDPIGRARLIAKVFGHETPASCEEVVRYMMGQPLDFDPGTRMAYSNLGYLLLGRAIEAVSGQSYEQFTTAVILKPLRITGMKLGRAMVENREPNEVRYYDSESREFPALYPPLRGQNVPVPDGAENFEAYEAHGGWIGSAVDLVRFASALDANHRSKLLKPETARLMWQRPSGLPESGPAFYGCGWQVRERGNRRVNAWHTGLISGTSALLVRRFDGFCWAALFNTDRNPQKQVLSGLIDPLIHTAVDAVRVWPKHDLFSSLL